MTEDAEASVKSISKLFFSHYPTLYDLRPGAGS